MGTTSSRDMPDFTAWRRWSDWATSYLNSSEPLLVLKAKFEILGSYILEFSFLTHDLSFSISAYISTDVFSPC